MYSWSYIVCNITCRFQISGADVCTVLIMSAIPPDVAFASCQGRGDGPKASTSGASEAARAKPGARPGVCFVYHNWGKPAQWDRRNRTRLSKSGPRADISGPEHYPLYNFFCFYFFVRIFQIYFFQFFGWSGQYDSSYRLTAYHAPPLACCVLQCFSCKLVLLARYYFRIVRIFLSCAKLIW